MTRLPTHPRPWPLHGLLMAIALFPSGAMAQAMQAAAAPVVAAPDKGDAAWLMTATALVALMAMPGLALFYGGLVRARNVLSVLMQVLSVFCMIAVLWVLFGYSLAFTGASTAAEAGPLTPFIGGLSKAFLAGVTPSSTVASFSAGVSVPELAYVAFQMTFACITPGLIVGAVAERMRFSALLLFLGGWFVLSYLPMAHMVWWWGGPEAAAAPAGWLFARGALDFAGGTVVHINAGIAGLVAAIMVGPRLGHGREQMLPHNLTVTLLGAGLLWFGWIGFNAGSALEANGTAALALVNTLVAPAAGGLAWAGAEWMRRGRPSVLGAASGVLAGLVGITPGAGLVGPGGAIAIGLVCGPACLWAVSWLKTRMGYDDSLDVFGLHGIGAIVGALATGIFVNPALGGTGVWDYAAGAVAPYAAGPQMLAQATGVGLCILWSAVVSLGLLAVLRATIGLRVPRNDEREGLDLTSHGERAYG